MFGWSTCGQCAILLTRVILLIITSGVQRRRRWREPRRRNLSGGAEILILNPTSSQPAASMVKCYAQTICLKNDPRGIEEYKRHHADCWPEVLGALKAVGVLRMKIFLLETRMFMYMETEDDFDPEVDFPRHLEMSPRCVEWGKLMSTFQTPAPEAKDGEWWAYMEEVYDFESQYDAKLGPRGSIG